MKLHYAWWTSVSFTIFRFVYVNCQYVNKQTLFWMSVRIRKSPFTRWFLMFICWQNSICTSVPILSFKFSVWKKLCSHLRWSMKYERYEFCSHFAWTGIHYSVSWWSEIIMRSEKWRLGLGFARISSTTSLNWAMLTDNDVMTKNIKRDEIFWHISMSKIIKWKTKNFTLLFNNDHRELLAHYRTVFNDDKSSS